MNTARIAAGLTGASLLLSSFPAYATGLSVGVGSNGSVSVGNGIHSHVDADAKADYKAAKTEAHADFKSSMSAAKQAFKSAKTDVKVDVDTDAKVSTAVLVKLREHLTSTIKRAVTRVAAISKNVCKREPNETAVKACMDKAKADFKASVNAMIDASFGA